MFVVNVRQSLCIQSRNPFTYIFVNFIHRAMCTKLFDDREHASLYAQYRPTYPAEVYKTITDFYERNRGDTCNYELAVDVGCGNGQSTLPLCKIFKSVIGYDVSQQQIVSAPKDVGNLTFKVGPAEDLGFLKNDSVDLVSVAQALHWFDLDKFYKEVRRVVKPGGVFVAYGYGNNVLEEEEADKLVKEHYVGLWESYWAAERQHIDEHYSRIGHPFKDWNRIEDEDLCIRRTMPVEAFIGYMSTWSAWRTCLKDHPNSDKLEKLKSKFVGIYKGREVSVHWPVFMLIGSKETC